MPTRQGSFRLFKLFGIEVFLHWSWFLIVLYEIEVRHSLYTSVVWNVLECLALFGIVLVHEFGHALACRSVGGQANLIVLWPFGGVAYVAPPQRPGAQLWSIAAGPLVNVILFPVFSVLWMLAHSAHLDDTVPNAYYYVVAIWQINLVLLVFNMLPIYPLDGGQILRSLLWFILGRATSLIVATVIGFIGVAGLVLFAIWAQSIWLGAICVFISMNCYRGFMQARELLRLEKAPRHEGLACPNCKIAPPAGDFYTCGKCRNKFDPFATRLVCPHCNTAYARMACLECGAISPLSGWAPGESTNV